MSDTHHFRHDCRLCHGTSLEKVLALAPTPPANELVRSLEEAQQQDKYPLDLYFCNNCFHVQLLDVVSPQRLFSNYVYVSGTAPSFRAHFQQYAATIIDDYQVPPDSLVVDIGSNDGTLLAAFKASGMRVQGVDPATRIAATASVAGIDTIADFFDSKTAESIRSAKGLAKIVVANNVFAHIDDLQGILDGVAVLLDANGVLVIEVSYLKDVVEKTLFDTIYHEHLDYHAVGPLRSFFERNGFQILDVVAIASHGGSIRVVVQRQSGSRQVKPSVAACISAEEAAGLYRAETFRAFQQKIDRLGDALKQQLQSIRAAGKTIAAYGLPAKATTLMHQFGIDRTYIDYVVDDSPLKQGLYSPGFGIRIHDSAHLETHVPDYIIVLAWNFADPIIKNLSWFLERGGAVIVPLPEIKTVRKNDQALR